MSFRSQLWIQSLSDAEKRQLEATHLPIGYHPTKHDAFLVPMIDRYAGMYILGTQGMGKSGFLENIIWDDAAKGNAVIVLDPHEDLVESTLASLPEPVLERTFVLDMMDEEYPFGLNLFSGASTFRTNAELTAAVERIMHVFEVQFADVLSQVGMPRYLTAATLALLSTPGHTLVDMLRLLTDHEFRNRLVPHISDPLTKRFWKTYDELQPNEQRAQVQPLVARLETLFMGRALIRNVLGQRQTTINFRRAIEQRQVLMVKLPVRRMGRDATLIGTVMLSQILAAIFSYADVPADQRPGVTLVIDEFQSFTTKDIAILFSEGRKFGVRLVIAHQVRGQLPDYLRDGTMTARNKVCFRTTLDDARDMAREFPSKTTRVLPEDINPHPVEYLIERGSENQVVKDFTDVYLRQLQRHRKGNTIVIKNFGHSMGRVAMQLAAAVGGGGTEPDEIRVPDPQPFLDHLLYEVMLKGDPNLEIPFEAVGGFSNVAGNFFWVARSYRGDALYPGYRFPPHLVVQQGETATWTREPRTQEEWLLFYVFMLRQTMKYLARFPIGKVTQQSPNEVATMLSQLTPRAAFVHANDDVGVIYTYDTHPHLHGQSREQRAAAVLNHTRQTYCRPREDVEREIFDDDDDFGGAPSKTSKPNPKPAPPMDADPDSELNVRKVVRWQEVEEQDA